MEASGLIERVQECTDLELAILLSLVAGEHCIVQTEEEALDSLEDELELIASNVFGLSHTVIQCTTSMSLDDFSNGVLIEGDFNRGPENGDKPKSNQGSFRKPKPTSSFADPSAPLVGSKNHEDDRKIANVVLLKNLNLADPQVQIQVLEILRTKRIFTRTAFYSAPKVFLIVVLKTTSGAALVNHLNDHLFISHYHQLDDGFANLEEGSGWFDDDRESLTSVLHHSPVQDSLKSGESPVFSHEDIRTLTDLSKDVTVAGEVMGYLHNIITFLRLHRAVDGGITPRATRHFNLLVRSLAPLHHLDFVTPSLVTLAARKIYSHRVNITKPENERSMQYGSHLAAVTALLDGVTAEQVIEEVLATVEVPL